MTMRFLIYYTQNLEISLSSKMGILNRLAAMGKYSFIQGIRFTPHPDIGNRDILNEALSECKSRGIRIVPYVSTGNRLAITMLERDYPEYAHHQTPGGGPKSHHNFSGEQRATVCWSSPYRQAYLDFVSHLINDYDISGLYFDAWLFAWYGYSQPYTCYCKWFQDGFLEASGQEIPYRSNHKGYTEADRKIIRKYLDWKHEIMVNVFKEVRRLAKKAELPLLCNIHNPSMWYEQDARITSNMDGFMYEHVMVDNFLERAEAVTNGRGRDMPIWTYVGKRDPWTRIPLIGYEAQQEIFTDAMFTGASIVAKPNPYLHTQRGREYIKYPFSILDDNAENYVGFENYPFVLTIMEPRRKWGNRILKHAQDRYAIFHDLKMIENHLGAFSCLLYGHVQVCSALRDVLEHPEFLAKYKVIYLPDIPYLSESQIKGIKTYVINGGNLVVSFLTSLYDEEENLQPKFALEELIRIAPLKPDGQIKRDVEYYQSGYGGASDLFILGRTGNDLKIGEVADQMIPVAYYQTVEVLSGGKVVADFVGGEDLRPILPATVVSQYGKGKVIYIASASECLYLQKPALILERFLNSVVINATSEPSPYTLKAPQGLVANMTFKDNTRVLHLTNWTGNRMERIWSHFYYIAPIKHVEAQINLPHGKKVRSLKTIINSKYTWHQKGNKIVVKLPKVEAYQAIVVEFY
jgi:hypothetical protein